MIWVTLAASLIGLGYAFLIASTIKKKEVGDDKLKEISGYIKEGASAFLNAEYRVILIFAGVVVAFLFAGIFLLDMDWKLIPAFILGALFSATAGNIGMRVATMANAKTAWACKDKMVSGLRIAFNSGAVMGLTVVGLGVLGVTFLYSIFGDVNMLFGFGFGASSIALFARVGGGIYTKAADVGADLVGKVEAGIPEDDPRNPATIADNVGDNVGDVAGMGADLFESYVDSIIAAMALGIVGVSILGDDPIKGGSAGLAVILPLVLAGWGIISAVIGTLLVGGKEGTDPHKLLNRGIYGASIIMGIGAFIIIFAFFGNISLVWPLFVSMLIGLGAGLIIGKATEYYTSDKDKPTQKVAKSASKGAATNIIAGLGLGMVSTIIPVLAVVVTILIAYVLSDLYGIALAAVGMLSTLGITLATDTYGPVADNAAGLAEMAGMGKQVRKRAEDLDAVGNTTAAIGKGFAIGSAGLTALALFTTYIQTANLDLSQFTLVNPYIVAGLFIGGLLPFVFSALTMQAVGDAAQDMVEEVRRQFRENKGIMEGKTKPDYQRCVEISTKGAIKRMVIPSLIAVLAPILVGIFSMEALGGLLAGSIVTGFVLAVMMANSGGAWDNAKKFIEAGNLGGKGSDPHKAAVVGDTVGDPFKDTSGPALNILIKLMSIVSLVFVPLFIILNALF
ncbi:MAG: sodium-translocating pyrophosphatase [Thermoplasmatota archaeon]